MQNRQEKSSRNGGNHHESKQKWDIYYNTLPDPKSQGVITMDQEIRRLMPEEMTKEQELNQNRREALNSQRNRLSKLIDEYEDMQLAIHDCYYLTFNSKAQILDLLKEDYEGKIEKSQNEIRDLTIALDEAMAS